MMIKKVVIFSLSLGLTLSFLGARQAKAEVVSLRATYKLKDNLIICSVTIKNMGSQALHINPNHFSLITEDGTSHTYRLETYSDYGYFLSKDLSPEEELKGKLVFEVFGKPEYLVFDGGGAKAKASLTKETLKEKEIKPIEQPKIEERKEPAALAEIQPESIYQKEVEDLKKTLSEKESQIAFLKEGVKKLGDKLTEVMKEEKEEKEEAERLKTEVEEQSLKLKEKEEFLSKCQEDKAIKEELLSKCQGEKEKGPNNKSKLIPFIFLIWAAALIVAAK